MPHKARTRTAGALAARRRIGLIRDPYKGEWKMIRKMVGVLGVCVIAMFVMAIGVPMGAHAEDAVIKGTVSIDGNGVVTLKAEDGEYKVMGIDLSGYNGKEVSVSGTIVDAADGQVINATEFKVEKEGAVPGMPDQGE